MTIEEATSAQHRCRKRSRQMSRTDDIRKRNKKYRFEEHPSIIARADITYLLAENDRLEAALTYIRDHTGDRTPSDLAGLVLQGWTIEAAVANVYHDVPLPALAPPVAEEKPK